jgi:hypothetical protein
MPKHRIHLGDDVRDLDFRIGQVVRLRVAAEPDDGLVTGYLVDAHGVTYRVGWSDASDSMHYALELTATATDPD